MRIWELIQLLEELNQESEVYVYRTLSSEPLEEIREVGEIIIL